MKTIRILGTDKRLKERNWANMRKNINKGILLLEEGRSGKSNLRSDHICNIYLKKSQEPWIQSMNKRGEEAVFGVSN